jgi:sugar lactone lactonase YvrE
MVSIRLDDIHFVGSGLSRPELVLTTRSGDLFVSDKRGGIATFRREGPVKLIQAKNGPDGFLPNGFALLADRSFLIANIGPTGGVYHMTPDGVATPRLLEINGRPLPPTNFVGIDREDRVWVTVSTWLIPREPSFRKGYADGFIIVMDKRGARIVAENIASTNEAIVSPDGEWLYVNETMGQRTSRFRIRSDGSLGPKELVAQYGPATFPDGMTFDNEGGVWIVSVASNRVVRVDAKGKQEILLEDADPENLKRVVDAFENGTFGRPEVDSGRHRMLANLSSLAFGDEDLHTVYLGSLFGERIAYFKSPIRGAEPIHWNF